MTTLKNESIPYSHEELFGRGHPPVYTGRQLDNIAFPLGGIGTGMVSLGGWGQLRDLEIFNRPNKGASWEHTFFTLYAKQGKNAPVTKVLQGPEGGSNWDKPRRECGAGLPRFEEATFTGRFPLARIDFVDKAMPLEVAMEAYNPFIPLNEDDSSLPAAMFMFHLTNPTEETVKATLFANMSNLTGYPEHQAGGRISVLKERGVRGLLYETTAHGKRSPRYGTMALATPYKKVTLQTHWYRGRWFDAMHDFWDHATTGDLEETLDPAVCEKGVETGGMALKVTLKPGESASLPVWLIWHNPNFEKYWDAAETKPTWKNYYAKLYADAGAVARYLGKEHKRLEQETRLFADALYASTLPASVMDAVASQLSILKTTTCLRLQDGTFYAFEGCTENVGCCEGTCTHVWNYAQALPYLFPRLARSVRKAEYAFNLHKDGQMTFRLPLPLKTKANPTFHAAADGQMGGVLKVYREWLICGDDEWLKGLWPQVKRSLEYAWKVWDMDRDGVMEGIQHNTYDIEFHGPNAMMGTFYLAALRAGEEMAIQLGDADCAEQYRELFEKGRALLDLLLYNGEYFEQDVRPAEYEKGRVSCHGEGTPGNDSVFADWPKYQFGQGCLSDQLIGQWFARMLHLGPLVEEEHIESAIGAIFKHNWRSTMADHVNPQRVYALNDEAGLLLCSWPRGGRPGFPFVYSDEVWPGIEYQVASHLIYEGLVEEGLAVVKGVRDRFDGTRRNPWNESECGNHYARSMASYSLMLALSDFLYCASTGSLSLAPRVYENQFACFFSVDSGWGMVRQVANEEQQRMQVRVLSGELKLRNLQTKLRGEDFVLYLDEEVVPAEGYPSPVGFMINLLAEVVVKPGQNLTLNVE